MRRLLVGSRTSRLAQWQARQVIQLLEPHHVSTHWTGIKTHGDLDQTTALDQFGERGVFTKALDEAILIGRIDLAIHSLKDCPAVLHPDLKLGCVLKRDFPSDVLVCREESLPLNDHSFPFVIGTSSSRRKAQWKYKYPKSVFVDLRGNVPTRLDKLHSSRWHGIILSEAGIRRLELKPDKLIQLNWMIPAPGQGVICAVSRKSDQELSSLLLEISHANTFLYTKWEREVMKHLEYSCSAPMGIHAEKLSSKELSIKICVCPDSGKVFYFTYTFLIENPPLVLDIVRDIKNKIK